MYLRSRGDTFGSFGGVFDDASAAIARGISGGVDAALPRVRTAIQEVVRDTLPTVRTALVEALPSVQSRLTDAIREGLTQGAMRAKTELTQASTDILPALEESVEKGGDKLLAKIKPWLIGAGIVVGAGLVALVALQYEQVRLLKSGRRA